MQTRSLKTLRAEALYATAAPHHAHEVVTAVLRERVLEGAEEV